MSSSRLCKQIQSLIQNSEKLQAYLAGEKPESEEFQNHELICSECQNLIHQKLLELYEKDPGIQNMIHTGIQQEVLPGEEAIWNKARENLPLSQIQREIWQRIQIQKELATLHNSLQEAIESLALELSRFFSRPSSEP
ncbi:MAG: hypothetical protein D6785_00185, partial [Planctomycetota bacterium]